MYKPFHAEGNGGAGVMKREWSWFGGFVVIWNGMMYLGISI